MEEIIVCAAIRFNGKVICGPRHRDAIMYAIEYGITTLAELNKTNCEDGFVTNNNRFIDRKEAAIIAIKNNQIRGSSINIGEPLFSEDLY